MNPDWTPKPRRVAVATAPIVALLRAAVGSPLLAPLPDEDAGFMGQPLPDVMAIDAGAWVAWCLAGLHACERLEFGQDPGGADEHTSWPEVIGETAKRMVTVLAMRRAGGNLSHAAVALRASRRALRERLKEAGLYPWPHPPEPTPQQRLDAMGIPRLTAAVLAMRPLAVVGSDVAALETTNAHGRVPRAAKGPGALAVVQALASILEFAARSHAGGFDPDLAILLALNKHRPSLALECVARAAWALVVRADDASTTTDDTAKRGRDHGGAR